MADDIKVVADFSDLQLMRRELVGVSKDAKSSASVFEREFSRVERQLVKSAKEAQKYYDTTLKVNKASKSASASAKVLERELDKQEKEFRQNSAAAQQFYNELLGVSNVTKSASSSASIFDRELNKIERSSKRATAAQDTFSNTSRKGMRRTEIIAQQAGFQIGDLAVQLQGGTNAAVALGQQGSQLLGFFGPAGAIAGAALAIGTGLIAPFVKARGEVVDLNEQLEKTRSALSWLDTNSDIIQRAITDPISTATRELKGFVSNLNEIKFEELSKGLKAGVLDIVSPLEQEANSLQAKYDRTVEQATKNIERLRKLGRDKEVKDELLSASEKMNELFNKIKALREVSGTLALGTVGEDADELQANMLKAVQSLEDSGYLTDALKEKVFGLMEQTGLSTKAVEELKEVFAGVSDEVKTLAKELGISLDLATKLVNVGKPKDYSAGVIMDPRNPNYDPKAARLARISQRMEDGSSAYSPSANKIKKQAEAVADLEEKTKELTQTQKILTSTLEEAAMTFVDGTSSIRDAFKGLIRDMILDIYREKVAKSFASTVFSLFGFANGGVFSNGSQVNAFADGGVVGGPTYFPMSGGQTGLMGEAGPEAIMPLKRGADGKLGVQMNGGGEQVVVNQNINISTGVQQTVRNEIQSMMPQIAAQSKSAVLDAKRRGGSYGGKF